MVKFGKEFRKLQLEKWKDKYFNYKKLKQMIKAFFNKNAELEEKYAKESIDRTGKSKISKRILNSQTIEFKEEVEKNIKTVFLFYAKNEKMIYKSINTSLYQKDDYPELTLKEFSEQFNSLKNTANNCLEISNYVFLNMKALFKILKKFDKKILVKNGLKEMTLNFVQSLLENTNSDLLYMFNFKLIDECCALLEDMNLSLKEEFEKKYSTLEEDSFGSLDTLEKNMLEKGERDNVFKSITDKMIEISEEITENIKSVDQINTNIKGLFKRWENYIMISSQVNNKVFMLNKDNMAGSDPEAGRRELYFSHSSSSDSGNNGEKGSFKTTGFDAISMSSAISVMFQKRNYKSITSTVFFSKENKINVGITFIHIFFYCAIYGMHIPIHYEILSLLDKTKFSGFVMGAAPLGIIFSYLFVPFISVRSSKKPLLISDFMIIVGIILFILSLKISHFYFMIIGRFLIGLGSPIITNKIYFYLFIPKQKIKSFLNYFNYIRHLGTSIGFLINFFIFLNYKRFKTTEEIKNLLFNHLTIGSWIILGLYIVILIGTIILFSEAFHPSFVSSNLLFNQYENEELRNTVRQDTIMINDLDEKMGEFNQKSSYNDMNLVDKTVMDLATNEKKHLSHLLNSFVVFMLIILCSKFNNELMLSLSSYSLQGIQLFYFNLFLFGCYSVVLICEIYLGKGKKKNINEKLFILILLIINIIVAVLGYEKIKISNDEAKFMIIMGCLVITSNISERLANNFFTNIIPTNYRVCPCCDGNLTVNFVYTFGKLIGGILPFIMGILSSSICNYIIYGLIALLSLAPLIFILCYYSELRIKAISRIIKGYHDKKISVCTEL